MMMRHLPLLLLASAAFADGAAADDPTVSCIAGGGGRLAMEISGAFEADIDWGNEGTICEGGPRPEGDALRLMFSREEDGLLVVLGITGLQPGGVQLPLRQCRRGRPTPILDSVDLGVLE